MAPTQAKFASSLRRVSLSRLPVFVLGVFLFSVERSDHCYSPARVCSSLGQLKFIRGGLSGIWWKPSSAPHSSRHKLFNVTVTPHLGINFGIRNGVVDLIREGAPDGVTLGCRVTHVNGTYVAKKTDAGILGAIAKAIHLRANIQITLLPSKGYGVDFHNMKADIENRKPQTPVERYAERWDNIDSDDGERPTGLPDAAQDNNLLEVERKIKAGADPLERNAKGWSALHIAAFKGYNEIVRIVGRKLKEEGDVIFSPRVKDEERKMEYIDAPLRMGGPSALYLACQQGQTEAAKILLSYNASTEFETCTGATPLYIACQSVHEACVKVLLDHGANPNHICGRHGTASNAAARVPSPEILSLLVQRGADFSIKSKDTSQSAVEVLGDHNLTINQIFDDPQDRIAARYNMRIGEILRTPKPKPIPGYIPPTVDVDEHIAVSANGTLGVEDGHLHSTDATYPWEARISEKAEEIEEIKGWTSDDDNDSDDDDEVDSQLDDELENYLRDPRGRPPDRVAGMPEEDSEFGP